MAPANADQPSKGNNNTRTNSRQRRHRTSKQDITSAAKNEKIETKGNKSQNQHHSRNEKGDKSEHPVGKMGRRPTRMADLKVDFHPYRHPVNSPALTPTAALAVAMCNQALDSPAFNTRHRDSALRPGEHDVSTEVQRAVAWWVHGLSGEGGDVNPDQKKRFKDCLYRCRATHVPPHPVTLTMHACRRELEFRCVYHWYPGEPQRGSGYRSVLSDINVDVALARACAAASLPVLALPRQRIMFVNPGEVKVVDTQSNAAEVVYHAGYAAVDGAGEVKRGNVAVVTAFNAQVRERLRQSERDGGQDLMPPPPPRKSESY